MKAVFDKGVRVSLVYALVFGICGAVFQSGDASAGARVGGGVGLALIGVVVFVVPWVGYWWYHRDIRLQITDDGMFSARRVPSMGPISLDLADEASVEIGTGSGSSGAAGRQMDFQWAEAKLIITRWNANPEGQSAHAGGFAGPLRSTFNNLAKILIGVDQHVYDDATRADLARQLNEQIAIFSSGKPDWIE